MLDGQWKERSLCVKCSRKSSLKWENTYKHMYKVTKQDKAKAVDDDDDIEAQFEMDVNMLCMEV
jgi:hypothetical protein